MVTEGGAYSEKHNHHHSDTEAMERTTFTDRTTFSGPLNKRGSRKSARFNTPDSKSNDQQDYVEITLDVREDSSVAVHSVKTAGGDDVEDPELAFLARGLEKRSSFGSSIVRNASSKIRQVSQELKRLASLNRHHPEPLDKSKSAAAIRAIKGLKFISKTDGAAGWAVVEKRFDQLTATSNGVLPRSLFCECIGTFVQHNLIKYVYYYHLLIFISFIRVKIILIRQG